MAIFCTIYYILSYIETVPQIAKLIKTKSSNDYSLGMITIQLIALICWSIYVFTSIQSVIVYIGTIVDLILLLLVDFLILKYYKFNKTSNHFFTSYLPCIFKLFNHCKYVPTYSRFLHPMPVHK